MQDKCTQEYSEEVQDNKKSSGIGWRQDRPIMPINNNNNRWMVISDKIGQQVVAVADRSQVLEGVLWCNKMLYDEIYGIAWYSM